MAELREQLADVLNTVAYHGKKSIVYVTRHGRRLAAIVPVEAAEDLEEMFGRPLAEPGAIREKAE